MNCFGKCKVTADQDMTYHDIINQFPRAMRAARNAKARRPVLKL